MFWYQRRKPQDAPAAASERLWHDLRELFDDEGLSYAGDDVGFDGLGEADVVRLWDYLTARATSIGDHPLVWDRNREAISEPPAPAEAVALLARGEVSYVRVALEGVQSRDVLLPELIVELWPDALSMYWWVGEGSWDPTTVAAFVELLDKLHSLVPEAHLAYELSNTHDFWGPVKRYLEATREPQRLSASELAGAVPLFATQPDGLAELRGVLVREHEWRVREGLV